MTRVIADAKRAVPEHVSDNIEAIASVARQMRLEQTSAQRAVEAATNAVARPGTVAAIVALAAVWCTYNLLAPSIGAPRLDAPPFFWLQGVIGMYAAVVATMVLTVQRRQTRHAEQRAHLELQVNLLAEQKATKIIALLEELRRDLPLVDNREDPLASALQEKVDPSAVLTALELTLDSSLPTHPESTPRPSSLKPTSAPERDSVD